MSPCRTRSQSLLGLVLFCSAACAEMRQNLRGQELSYRGAWHCSAGNCDERSMTRSTLGRRDGEVNIAQVRLEPRAALLFVSAAPADSLDAVVADCGGRTATVPATDIKKPGTHGITGQQEAWVIVLDRERLAPLELGETCRQWRTTATGHWHGGSTYSLTAAIEVGE